MNILINRTNTNNKGAELMLYAVLHELEQKYPDANVILPYTGFSEGLSYIKTSVKLIFRNGKWLYDLFDKSYLLKIGRRISMPLTYFSDMYPVKDIDYFLDAGGFQFSDQIGYHINTPERWGKMLDFYKRQGTKMIFLPQAFGPFNKETGKRLMLTIGKYSDLIFARENISYQYLIDCGLNKDNIRIAPDFTLPVKGNFPQGYNDFKNGVAIIPNLRMVDKGVVTYGQYLKIMENIVCLCKDYGHKAFLLNHEGKNDEKICFKIAKQLSENVRVVTGLNALEVKGLIGGCYAVISSRFHGVASSLSQSIPVLATSWSHKYELLFKNFGVNDGVIDIKDDTYMQKISRLLDERENSEYRALLKLNNDAIAARIDEMWEKVWSI